MSGSAVGFRFQTDVLGVVSVAHLVTRRMLKSLSHGRRGEAARRDVKRSSNNNPCGGGADMSAIDSSTAVTADASGSFTVDIQNFNGGRDGSRLVKLELDASRTGQSLSTGTVAANGQAAPANTGTEKITASLLSGTQRTGRASGNLCIASFTTAGGFGNCVIVQQGRNGAGGAAAGNGNGNGNTSDIGNGANNNNARNGNGNTINNNNGNGSNRNNNANSNNRANRNNGNARGNDANGNEVQNRNTRKRTHRTGAAGV